MPSKDANTARTGYRTLSGHAAFAAAASKPWESGQRPRTLQPGEMPWARGRPPGSPNKTLSGQASLSTTLKHAGSTAAALRDASAAAAHEEEAQRSMHDVTDDSSPTQVHAAASWALMHSAPIRCKNDRNKFAVASIARCRRSTIWL